MIRVVLPVPLRTLARIHGEIQLELAGAPTQHALIDALEARYPTLQGTIRDRETMRRRPFVRFYAGEEDLSHEPPDAPLPAVVVEGWEPFYVVGAMAGG